MPSYMLQVSYTSEAWEAMCDEPFMCMPIKTVKPVVEELAKAAALQVQFMEGWGAFGEYDAVAIITAKDNLQASAVAIALLGRAVLKLKGRAIKTFKAVKTTPLLDPKMNETEQAFQLGGQYKPLA
jgi:uncharacterized protein with GYD domain